MNSSYFGYRKIVVVLCCFWLVTAMFAVSAQAVTQDSYEPNNNKDNAAEIETGTQISAILGWPDGDWYKFQAEEGDSISIEISGYNYGPASLIGPDGTQLDADSPQANRLSTTAEQAGTYYIKFGQVGSANGDYSFIVELSDSDDTNSEAETSDENSSDENSDQSSEETNSEAETLAGTSGEEDSDRSSGDQWPDKCSVDNAPLATGTYVGHIGPEDTDVITVDIGKGEYIAATLTVNSSDDEDYVRITTDHPGSEFNEPEDISEARFSASDGSDPNSLTNRQNVHRSKSKRIDLTDETVQFRAYNTEGEGPMCFQMDTDESSVADWTLTFERNTPDPPAIDASDKQISGPEEQNQTTTDQKRDRIEIETQIDQDSGEDVTIDATVRPQDQESFQTGGTAVVEATSEQADVSAMTVKYGEETYQIDESGKAAIPLDEAGEQELTLVYKDETETVMLNVQEQASSADSDDADIGDDSSDTSDAGGVNATVEINEESDDGAAAEKSNDSAAAENDETGSKEDAGADEDRTESSTDEASDTMPGFGIVGTAVVLLVAAFLMIWYRH